VELEVRAVSHHFTDAHHQEVQALDNIDLAVNDKEFVSVIGPSGCGKSTLIFIAAGLLLPSVGSVLHAGAPVRAPDPSRGVIFQADAVFPWLTVAGNVDFGLKRRHLSKDERARRVREYIELVGLSGWERRYPKELSGGMRKRVDIARVFANDPSVLLLDESFGQIDAQTRERLQLELLDLWQTHQKTVLFVTHDIEEALFLADRVIVMSARPGRIISELSVPFRRPRRADLKTEEPFQKLRRELSALLI
jgi:NitT/TauT family transport system ATP-binding protein